MITWLLTEVQLKQTYLQKLINVVVTVSVDSSNSMPHLTYGDGTFILFGDGTEVSYA